MHRKNTVIRRKGRGIRAYLNDFQRIVSGEYVYIGATYTFVSDSGKSRKSVLRLLWAFCGLAAASGVAQGFIPAGGMRNCAYVLIPFGLEIICAGCVIWALIQLSANKDPIREYVYVATVDVLPRRCILTAISAGLSCVGELIYALLHLGENTAGTWFLALLMAVAAASSVMAFRVIRSTYWERHEHSAN